MITNKIIETKAAQVVPDWVKQFNKKDMDYDYQEKLRRFDRCLVGDFRGRIGLSRDYMADDKECCDDCVAYAFKFTTIKRQTVGFINSLEWFLSHMEEVHNWKKDKLVEKKQEIINAIPM